MGSVSEHFTGRRDILEKIDTAFSARGPGLNKRRQFLVCGMGGAGKTQIALKFVETMEQEQRYCP
jgi:hypothetical protein